MPHLQTIEFVPPQPRWRRVLDALRSSWSGPLTSSSPELAKYFTAAPARSGVAVTGDSALTYPAFWAAVSLISADIASLPLILYRRLPTGGKERFADHQLYRILHDEPNPEMSSLVFRETLQAHLLVWGNAYAEIERDRLGRVAALWPLTPNQVQPFRERGVLLYRVQNEDGTQTILRPDEMLHVPGLGYDGYVGYSVVAKARESLGLGLAMQQFGATFFGNGSTFGGIFTTPRPLGPKEKEDTVANLRNLHQGIERAHKFVLLEGGLDYKQLGVPPDDAQFLESRAFHISDVARWFKLSPHKLADLSRATFSNIEHLGIDHVTTCLRPWATRWQQEINRKLIAPSERRIQFVEHLFDDLLRGDTPSRYAAYAVGRQWGWLSVDDIREKENMNPLPEKQGQMYLVPQNMWPADQIDKMVMAQSAKASAAPPPSSDSATEEVARQLDTMTQRAQLADETVAEFRAKLEAATQHVADMERMYGTSEQVVQDLRTQRDALSDQVSHLLLMSSDLHTRRDALAQELDAQRAATETAQREAEARQAALMAEEAARAAAETEAIMHRTAAEQALAVVDAERARAEADVEAARQLHETAQEAARQRQREAEEARLAAESALQAATAERDAAREELAVLSATRAEAVDAHAAAVRDLEAAQSLLREAEQQITSETQGKATEIAARRALEAEATQLRADVDTRQAELDARDRALADATQRAEQAAQFIIEAQTAREQSEAALRERDEAERERVGAVLAAHRALIVDVMRRMIERETDRARRAQTTPEKLRHWIDTFYPGHEELCVSALLPAIRVHTSWMGRHEDPETLTRMLVRQHIDESRRQISAVADGDGDELAGSLYQLFARWDHERTGAIADALLQKEIDRAAESR